MRLFNSFAVLAKISLVILVLKLTITVNNGEVSVINLERAKTKVVCQGRTEKLKCENSSQAMVIYSATYGRTEKRRTLCPFIKETVDQSMIDANDTDDISTCHEKNVTLEIMKLCDKKRRCIMRTNQTFFGSYCKGIYKILKVIYACEDKHKLKIKTGFPFNTTPSSNITTSPTPNTRIKPKTPRVTTLTKRKRIRTVNTTFRKGTTRTTKSPKVTKHNTAPLTPVKTTPKGSFSETPTTVTAISKQRTTKKRRKKTTLKTVSNVDTTVKPNITVLKSEVSEPVTTPVVLTNATLKTTERDKTFKTSTTSTGLRITIQVNGTNYTMPPTTVPITVTTRVLSTNRKKQPKTDKGPSPRGVSSVAPPAVMEQQSPAAVMGVAGTLYIWFLHMKENKSAYVTVFVLSALGAALIMVGVVACFVTLEKKKEFLKLDIIHKPKRFIALPKEAKTTNQNGHVPGKDAKVPDGEEAIDGMMLHKGQEVVFSAQDVHNQVKKEFNIGRYSGMENGTVHKGDPASIRVNPMFDTVNNNKTPNGTINHNQVIHAENEKVSSLPSTPARGRTQSEPRSGTPRRARANSTGNVPRSHDRHHSQGITNHADERMRLPRHLSAGNVSHQHRQAVSQNQSPAKTLPRQRSATANGPYCQSSLRNPLHIHPGGSAQPVTANGTSNPRVNSHTSQPQSPSRSVPNGSVVNQYPVTSGTLNNRHQSQGSVSQQLPPSRSPQGSSLGQPIKQVGPGMVGRDGEPHYQGSPLSFASGETRYMTGTSHSVPHQRTNPSMKLSNSSNAPLEKETNPGSTVPFSNHRNIPNVTTNPNFNNRSGDIWQKHNEPKVRQKEPSSRSLSSDNSNMQEGISQRRNVSSETSGTQEQEASKGTLRPSSMAELLSPLDALPDTYANNPSLRLSDRHSYNNNPGTSNFNPSPPPSPEQATDSSDDDLYSIVAKGTYTSAVPDPYLRQTAGATSDGREGKNKNKHVYVVIPSGDGSTAV